MLSQLARFCIMACACALVLSTYSTRAEEGGGGGGRKSAYVWVRDMIINHAEDYNLTADQKTKLNDLLDSPPPKSRADYGKVKEKVRNILTKEQWEKFESSITKKEQQRHNNNNDDNDDHK